MIWSDTNLTETGGGSLYRITYARSASLTSGIVAITSMATATKLLDYFDTWYPWGTPADALELRKAPQPRLCVRPFPAPQYLVAGRQSVPILAPPVRQRRPLRRVTGARDPRALRARPGRRGVLRREAEQARAEEDAWTTRA